MSEAGELEAIIARTALKYDLLPYDSKPFAQSQPARLGGLCRLFGLEAAPMETARVLELGCASGGNIIPHAARYPDAQFVGVDLARTQVAAGRARIDRLGLTNVEILCKSFTEIGEELGSFDYIICHGVYSWVPPQVQDSIMRVIRDRLSPVGVACVSYNVLPGWRMMQPLRDAFALTVPDGTDMVGRVAMAREILGFLSSATPDQGPYGNTLRNWAQRLSSLPDDYLGHEFLEDCNSPCLVRDFARAAGSHGLGYLGECEFAAMLLDNYGQELADGVRARPGNDLVASEQWLDLLSGRTFRQSLLISNERMAQVNRSLAPEAVADLHLVLPMGIRFETTEEAVHIHLPDGRVINAATSATRRMLETIAAQHPGSSCLADFICQGDGERAEMLDLAYRMVLSGVAQVSSEPVACSPVIDGKPTAFVIARSDAEAGATSSTNLRHETVAIDVASQVILPLIDGTHDAGAFKAALVAAAKAGRIVFQRDGAPVTETKAMNAIAAELLPSLLAGLATAGMVEK